jgi:integrase
VAGHSGPRKNGRIHAGEVLFGQFSRELTSLWTKPASREIALEVRDATLLLFLTLLPLRRRNLAALAVGQNLIRNNASWQVDFSAAETKTHRAFALSLPEPLCDALTRYLDDYRPLILAPDTTDSGALWIGDRGHPWSAHTLALRVSKLTLKRFGVAISPHLFRDSAVTTMVLASPALAALAGALLGHHTSETSRSHYLHARQIEAGRALQSRINQIKRIHR